MLEHNSSTNLFSPALKAGPQLSLNLWHLPMSSVKELCAIYKSIMARQLQRAINGTSKLDQKR